MSSWKFSVFGSLWRPRASSAQPSMDHVDWWGRCFPAFSSITNRSHFAGGLWRSNMKRSGDLREQNIKSLWDISPVVYEACNLKDPLSRGLCRILPKTNFVIAIDFWRMRAMTKLLCGDRESFWNCIALTPIWKWMMMCIFITSRQRGMHCCIQNISFDGILDFNNFICNLLILNIEIRYLFRARNMTSMAVIFFRYF